MSADFIEKKYKGSALGFTLVLLSLLLLSGITLVSVSVLERKASFSTQKSVIAFQAADSGLERVLKRIYVDNSPSLADVPLKGLVDDHTLADLAVNLDQASSLSCANGVVSGTNNSGTNYTFQVTFYDANGNTFSCSLTDWRDRAIWVRSEGFFQRTSRVIETGIRPRK